MAGRPSTKTKVEETKDIKAKEVENVTSEGNTSELEKAKVDNLAMAEMLKQMQAEMLKMKEQMDSKPNVVVAQDRGLTGKKIKCMNLMNNPLNISTEPDGRGRVYSFSKYGEFKMIKYDDLVDIVSSYPNTTEKGLFFICNKEAVEELGLTEDYEHIYSKEVLDELIYLRRDSDTDLFLCMSKEMQSTTATRIAELFNANETMDFNRIKKIKDETSFDIENIAKELKDFQDSKE